MLHVILLPTTSPAKKTRHMSLRKMNKNNHAKQKANNINVCTLTLILSSRTLVLTTVNNKPLSANNEVVPSVEMESSDLSAPIVTTSTSSVNHSLTLSMTGMSAVVVTLIGRDRLPSGPRIHAGNW